MKDFVIKIADIPPWRTALRAEAEAGSPYAVINEDTDEVKLNLPVTGVIATIGTATASICRLSQDQYDWLTGLPQVVELGSGSAYIKELSDVTWIGSGKGLYHAIHLQTPYDVDDGEGGRNYHHASFATLRVGIVTILAVFMCVMLVACTTAQYTINDRDFWFHLELVDRLPALYQHGLAQWDGQQCWVTLIESEYPRCLQHETRHCIEGQWHKEEWNNDDCFY